MKWTKPAVAMNSTLRPSEAGISRSRDSDKPSLINLLLRVGIAAIMLCLALPVHAEQHGSDELDLARKIDAQFATEYLDQLKRAEHEIIALNAELRQPAILAAAGQLNMKLAEWGQLRVNEGMLTPPQVAYIMGLATLHLSLLTQAAEMNAATACHVRESRELFSISKGNPRHPVSCRGAVYAEAQKMALTQAHRAEFRELEELVNEWATNAALLSRVTARLDEFGARPR